MDAIGPKYPFEPLPPPEPIELRSKVRQAQKLSDDLTSIETKQLKKPDFRKTLEKKAIEINKSESLQSEREKAKGVSEDLEAFFIYTILKKFNDANMKGGLFPKAAGSDMYMDMFMEGVANEVAHTAGGLGVSEMILKSIDEKIAQETQNVLKSESEASKKELKFDRTASESST